MKKDFLFFLISLLFSVVNLAAQKVSYADMMKDYDVKHYKLDLQISSTSADISGNVIITSLVKSATIQTFVIELVNSTASDLNYMVVDSVKMNNHNNSFVHQNDFVIVPLVAPINQDELFTAQIFYHGLALASGYELLNDGTRLSNCGINLVENFKQSYSMSESRGAKLWWPCKQDLTDKADSVTFCITTDSNNISGSNGILKSTLLLPEGKVKYTWKTNYPTDYYLISFAVGLFTENKTYALIQNGNDSVLIHSILNTNSPYYSQNLEGIISTKDLIGAFSEILGDYPFKDEKYGYCAIDDNCGGMENQTMTTINSALLSAAPAGFQPGNYTWVTAHELAHSWFGDYVTCKTWNDIWINEGIASYLEYVVLERLNLNTAAKEWIYWAHNIALSTNKSIYIPDSELNDDSRVFNFYLTYKKGAVILHMLRYEVNNDTLFFKGLKDFLSQYRFSTAGTEDFKNTMEAVTGTDLTDFFNQWYYGYGHPKFNIKWFQSGNSLIIKSNETGSVALTPFIKTHIDFKLNFASGDTIVRLFQDSGDKIFSIPVEDVITSIEADPKNWILKEIESITIDDSQYSQNPDDVFVYPNPFSSTVNFSYYLTDYQAVRADILSIDGSLVHTEYFDGVPGSNLSPITMELAGGIYFYKLKINGTMKTGKLIKQ